MLLAVLAAGCQPDLGARASDVTGLRVLAVSAEPPEAAPGAMVSYAALLVDDKGEQDKMPIDWAYCNQTKPLSDLGDVSSLCFVFGMDYLVPLGVGPAATGQLPAAGCSLFGPDVPPPMEGQPPGRPADPDLTGGYYQPVRLILQAGGQTVLGAGESRLVCGLPGATTETLQDFKKRYRVNTNPVIEAVSVVGKAITALVPDDGTSPGLPVKPGEKIELRAAWPACAGDAACGGSEPFVSYDPATRTIADRREAMTVSWFATGGTFDTDRSARSATETETTSDNGWTAPARAGEVTLWVVLRDERGGVSWERYRVDVR